MGSTPSPPSTMLSNEPMKTFTGKALAIMRLIIKDVGMFAVHEHLLFASHTFDCGNYVQNHIQIKFKIHIFLNGLSLG